MKYDIDQVAADWIENARYTDPNDAPAEIAARAWVLYELAEDNPVVAWEVIKAVVRSYQEEDFYSAERTEAQEVVGHLAAGPLEDWLSISGPTSIHAVEEEARRDRRMAWALGGVWKLTMTDDVWARVQSAADYSYWERPTTD
ncbi:DUF6869 domain-containing protein [Sphingopyxis sp. J-6]|uniref:DUF6869 domain-containing protein n=1 Tax=Sphingopyxis sp. J-6 TaxID=3122054 RepID=UPI0039841E4D